MSAAQVRKQREVRGIYLGLAEARFYLGCKGHMHAFHRPAYRSGAFLEDLRFVGVKGEGSAP